MPTQADTVDPAAFYCALGTLVVWLVAVRVVAKVARPPQVRALPPGPNLRDESPAVVNLLTERGRLNEDAARATLLDLAARKVFELHQPAADSGETMIRVRSGRPLGLRPYEELVFDRVTRIGGGERFVPLADLSGGGLRAGRTWRNEFDKSVRAEAASLGYTEARVSGAMTVLTFVAFLLALFLAEPVLGDSGHAALRGGFEGSGGTGTLRALGYACLAAVLFIALLAYTMTLREAVGLKPEGRGIAAYWLGVAQWLRAHENFGELPPAAVAVWDRYLSYGVALGTNPAAASEIDLRLGRYDTMWSQHGGQWHRVQVRRSWRSRGVAARRRLGSGVFAWLLGLAGSAGLLLGGRALLESWWPNAIAWFAASVLTLFGLYRVVTAVVDLVAPVTREGTVLRVAETGDAPSYGLDAADRVRLELVLDDGRGSTVRPWTVRAGRSDGCRRGDIVRLRGQRFGRYATGVTVVGRTGRTAKVA